MNCLALQQVAVLHLDSVCRFQALVAEKFFGSVSRTTRWNHFPSDHQLLTRTLCINKSLTIFPCLRSRHARPRYYPEAIRTSVTSIWPLRDCLLECLLRFFCALSSLCAVRHHRWSRLNRAESGIPPFPNRTDPVFCRQICTTETYCPRV